MYYEVKHGAVVAVEPLAVPAGAVAGPSSSAGARAAEQFARLEHLAAEVGQSAA